MGKSAPLKLKAERHLLEFAEAAVRMVLQEVLLHDHNE
jgi:hypothetical protein